MLSRERLLWPRGISLRLPLWLGVVSQGFPHWARRPLESCRWLPLWLGEARLGFPLWLGEVRLGFPRWAQRPLESGLLRPIGLAEMRLVGLEGCSTDGSDSIHGWLDPDLLAELFLFLLFVVVAQGPL